MFILRSLKAASSYMISSAREPRKFHLAGTWAGSIERKQYQIEQECVGFD